jgi:lysophospholipase L1-like esterase
MMSLLVLALSSMAMAQGAPATAPSAARAGRGRPAAKPINPALPTLWIIGDSTVKNGADTGGNGQWGWGNPIASYFDEAKINIQNRALGGTSSRTFYRDQWPAILEQIKKGDYVIMQFGHNDGGPINDDFRARGTFKDNSDRVEEIDNMLTKKHEVVHSYGWYLRQYWTEAKEKGAVMAIYCSPIPRKGFGPDGKMRPDSYGPIAKQAADQVGQPYIDLNERIIKEYEKVGPQKVAELYFPEGEGTHTDWAGAVLNAEIVVQALKDQNNPLAQYLKPEPPKDLKNPTGRAR